MSFGSSAYGTSAYGGTANAVNEQVFFPWLSGNYAPDVTHEAEVLFTGTQELYEIFMRQSNDEPGGVTYTILTSHGEGETPQQVGIAQGNGSQTVGAAQRIVVRMFIDGAIWATGENVQVVGRPVI